MTIEDKKTYLNSYIEQKRTLQRMQEEHRRLFLSRTSIGVNMDSGPRARNHSGLEVYAAKRDTLERAIIKQKIRCLDALEDIFCNIEQLTDPDPAKAEQYKIVLTYKHIEGLRMGELAQALNCTRQHASRLYRDALECFAVHVQTIRQAGDSSRT